MEINMDRFPTGTDELRCRCAYKCIVYLQQKKTFLRREIMVISHHMFGGWMIGSCQILPKASALYWHWEIWHPAGRNQKY